MVRKLFLSFILSALVLGFGIGSAQALTYTETFSGSSLNSAWWTSSATGGNTVDVVGGQLIMTQSFYYGSSAITFNYNLAGDFEVSVDYALLNWPTNNFERIGLSASGIGPVERSNHIGWFGDAYLTHFGDGVYFTNPTSDLSGKLKLARVGSTISGFYWSGSDWTLIHSYAAAGTDVTTISLAIWNGYVNNSDSPVKIAFDNFTIYAPDTPGPVQGVPEPATILLLGLGLVGMIGAKKKIHK
jgi:hypothetical protein